MNEREWREGEGMLFQLTHSKTEQIRNETRQNIRYLYVHRVVYRSSQAWHSTAHFVLVFVVVNVCSSLRYFNQSDLISRNYYNKNNNNNNN